MCDTAGNLEAQRFEKRQTEGRLNFTGKAGFVRAVDAQPKLDVRIGDISAGDLVIVKGFLQEVGLYEEIASLCLKVVTEVVSQDAADSIRQHGFEQMHRVLSGLEVLRLIRMLSSYLAPIGEPVVRFCLAMLRPPLGRIFAARQVWARIMMPEDVVASHRELLAGQLGHAIVHNPHRDYWFSQSVGVVNMWMALGRVSRGNSVLIYPEVFSRELSREGSSVSRTERIGKPMNFELERGDLLLFLGDHLHSSEVNITGETRFVLSTRFTIGPPCHGPDVSPAAYFEVEAV